MIARERVQPVISVCFLEYLCPACALESFCSKAVLVKQGLGAGDDRIRERVVQDQLVHAADLMPTG